MKNDWQGWHTLQQFSQKKRICVLPNLDGRYGARSYKDTSYSHGYIIVEKCNSPLPFKNEKTVLIPRSLAFYQALRANKEYISDFFGKLGAGYSWQIDYNFQAYANIWCQWASCYYCP